MTEFTELRDKITTRMRRDLERACRDKLASQFNDLVEACIKRAMDDIQISIDGETLKVSVTLKE